MRLDIHCPAIFSFYMTHNGGVADRDWWGSSDEYESVRVKKFNAVTACGVSDADESKY